MIVYVAQTAYPARNGVSGVLSVGSEWNKVMKQVMEHYDLDQYCAKTKLSDHEWHVHVSDDLHVQVTKFTVDAPIFE